MVGLYRFYCVKCDYAWTELSILEVPSSKCEFCKEDHLAEECQRSLENGTENKTNG